MNLLASVGASVALAVSCPAFADCDAYRHLEGRAWVDGDCMETALFVDNFPVRTLSRLLGLSQPD